MYKIAQEYTYLGNDRWSWRASIDGDDTDLDGIEEVTWYLHNSFSPPVVTRTNRDNRFEIERQGWGVFQIRAKLLMKDGTERTLTHWLELAYPEEGQDRGVATLGGAVIKAASPKNKIFLSYGAEDRNLVSGLRGGLEQRGYKVLDPSNIESGMPIEASIKKMVRESDLVMGFVTSEYISPFVVSELNEASQSEKPVLTVAKPGVKQPYGLNNNLQRVEIDFDSEDAGDNLADFLGKFEA